MSERFYTAFLGLGSNMGNRERLLADAIKQLQAHPSIQVAAASPLYETDPVGYTEQPSFLNMVCRIATTLTPEALLEVTSGIERAMGRERLVRWGPRTIDIDVLLYDNITLQTSALTIPHPRIMERAFVLVPLLDVMDQTEHNWRPGFAGLDIAATGVRRWTNTNLQDA